MTGTKTTIPALTTKRPTGSLTQTIILIEIQKTDAQQAITHTVTIAIQTATHTAPILPDHIVLPEVVLITQADQEE